MIPGKAPRRGTTNQSKTGPTSEPAVHKSSHWIPIFF